MIRCFKKYILLYKHISNPTAGSFSPPWYIDKPSRLFVQCHAFCFNKLATFISNPANSLVIFYTGLPTNNETVKTTSINNFFLRHPVGI